MESTFGVGRYLVRHLGFAASYDAHAPDEIVYPVARIRITRWPHGTVHRVLSLTPYATQTLVDDLAHTGHGTAVEITIPADVPRAFVARTERAFARLRPLDVEVVVRHADDDREAPPTAPAAPSLSRTVAEFAVLMGRLLHELQSERAITVAHLRDRDGRSEAHLEAQCRATDGVLQVWGTLLIANAERLPPLARMHADAVRSLVAQLPTTRRGVRERARESLDTVDYYTQLARAVLATADGLVLAADGPTIATAHLAFLHAKEEAALEQVEFASAAVRQSLAHCVAARVASREAYLRTFATTAPETVLSEYRALMAEPACCEATGLERAMIDHAECSEEPVDTETWYRSLGNIVDRFRDLEGRSAATLLQSAL